MWKCLPIVCFVGLLAAALPAREENVQPIHIIKPPVRCPEGMKPDANGRCREVWGSITALCADGEEPGVDGFCVEKRKECDGEECTGVKRIEKRDVEEEDEQTETFKPIKKQRKMEALKSEKKSKKRSYGDDGKARSKHAFLMMLKKKKMQMMKPKPPPPPPHHHHPPHDDEQGPPPPPPPEEEPATEAPAEAEPGMYWFANEMCVEKENSTGGCLPEVEVVDKAEGNKEFKEWKPEKASSSSSSSSSSSDSIGESESENESRVGSGESEDEVIEKAIKIKLMKLFRMRERYGPALRRWLIAQLREYEDSLDY